MSLELSLLDAAEAKLALTKEDWSGKLGKTRFMCLAIDRGADQVMSAQASMTCEARHALYGAKVLLKNLVMDRIGFFSTYESYRSLKLGKPVPLHGDKVDPELFEQVQRERLAILQSIRQEFQK